LHTVTQTDNFIRRRKEDIMRKGKENEWPKKNER
jgi:hypothetical protein